MEVGGQRHAPAVIPLGKTWCPLYRRLGGPQCRSGRVRKISSPPGFDPRTVQPVACRYSDLVIPAQKDAVHTREIFGSSGSRHFILVLVQKRLSHPRHCKMQDVVEEDSSLFDDLSRKEPT